MALIIPQGNLTVYHPAASGLTTVQGYSRDWFPSPKWQSGGGGEIITPLNALAPAGDTRPIAMAGFSINATYNQAVRQVITPGNPPVTSYEFYDNTAHAAGTAVTAYMAVINTSTAGDFWQPNFTVRLTRYAPPPEQGIVPQTVVRVYASVRVTASGGVYYLDRNGDWTDGQVTLTLPFASPAYKRALLLSQVGRLGSATWASDFSDGPDPQALDGGMARETWTFEYVEDTDRFDGGHILIRSSANPGDWWHTYNENIRLVEGPIVIGLAGCRQVINVSPIYYSDDVPTALTAWANDLKPLPSAEYETTAAWEVLETEATGWTETVAGKDGATVEAAIGYRPEITFTPATASATVRPVVWMVTEDHEPTIAVPEGLPAEEETEGDNALHAMSLRVDETWRGASGNAQFHRQTEAQYEGWLERGKAVMNFGWQTGAGEGLEAADTATMFIKPGGIKRDRIGAEEAGSPGIAVELGDLVEVLLRETCVVDLGQAGGFSAGSWFELCGHRLGLPDGMIDVAAAITATALPTGKPLPSTPNLKPQDGQTWEQHFDEVCKATGLRWGYNPFTGKLFLDGGRPAYSSGVSTITFTIDYDTTTEQDRFWQIEHVEDASGHRNRYKILYGTDKDRRAYYWTAEDAEIEADGADLWAVADDDDGDTVAEIQADLDDKHRRQASIIQWVGPLRRTFQPDQFVQIGDCPEIGLEVGAVYQVSEVHHRIVAGEPAACQTAMVAKRVYSPGGWY